MPLTDEQHAVIQAEDPILQVNAVAGSGKTTALLEFAAHRPDAPILSLADNRFVADVWDKTRAHGLGNLTVSTIHALACRHTGGHCYELEPDLSEWLIHDRYVPVAVRSGERGCFTPGCSRIWSITI
ncbi:MAG: hypothetical protein FIA97_09370 [Methylococcaceae bacterium]|nr:hypothetical protein [Methylococcaceae bacterium]